MPDMTVWVFSERLGGEPMGFDLYLTHDAAVAAAHQWALEHDASETEPDRWATDDAGWVVWLYEETVHAAPPHPLPV